MKKISLVFVAFLLATQIHAQEMTTIPFDENLWDIGEARFTKEKFQGKEAILLTQGTIFAKDVELLDGVIEVDINFSNRRNFPGLRFRLQDRANFEDFYIRPHQSGQPDANQYTPVFNGNAGWQIYYGKGWATPVTYEYGVWHHIKVELNGGEAAIYFDNMDKPILEVDLLRDPQAGKIGIGTGIAPVYFANLSYSIKESTTPAQRKQLTFDSNQLTSWKVSQVLTDNSVVDKYKLDKSFKSQLKWDTYPSENKGEINLDRYRQRKDDANTVAIKVDIKSDQAAQKIVDFGFSDRVRVFLNDQAIYEGNDGFRTRDHRFLGTVGYFDKVFLDLKKGNNELWFLVSEGFGGWMVQAKFDDMEGITILE